MSEYKNQGCRKHWYRYHFDRYRYQPCSVSGYRYHFGWYWYHFASVSLVLIPTLFGTDFGSISWVPVPPLFGIGTILRFCLEMAEFPSLTHFSSINLPNSILQQNPPWNPSKPTPKWLITQTKPFISINEGFYKPIPKFL